MKEFIYEELGIGPEQEEKLIVEQNKLKFNIISDKDVDGDDIEIKEKIINTINSSKFI